MIATEAAAGRDSLGRWHRAVFSSRVTQVWLAAAYGCLVITFAFGRRYLDTEGVFIHNLAVNLADGYWEPLFSLKAKPPLQLLYAPFSNLGFDAFLTAHATFAAAGVWLVAEAARQWRLPNPNLAGWLMAMSLGYTFTASNGLANSDGAVFSALFFFLYASRRHTAAAIVLSLLPFVRHELAVLALVFLVWDFWQRRRWGFLASVCAVPLVYCLLGAIHYGDLLWPITYFPNPTGIPGDIRDFDLPSGAVVGRFLLDSLAINFGVLGLFAPFAWENADRRVRLLLAVAGGTIAAVVVLQYTGSGIDLSLRYHVALLPQVAILATHAFSSPSRSAWLGAGVLVVVLFVLGSPHSWFLTTAFVVVIWRVLAPNPRIVAQTELLLFATALLFSANQLFANDYGRQEHAQNHRVMRALAESGIFHGQPILTDLSTARYDRCADLTAAAFLANESIRWYIDRLSPPGTAWYGPLEAAFRRNGFLIDAEHHTVQTDAIYVFRAGERMRSWRHRIDEQAPTALPLVDGYSAFYWPTATPVAAPDSP